MLFCFGNTFGQCVIVSTATSPLCYGDANGQLLVEVSPLCGCQLPLYFRIKNSSTNQVIETTGQINSLNYLFENLPVGSYIVDACQDGSFTEFVSICASGGGSISSNPPLNVVTSNENVLCNSQATGSIEITISSPNIGYPGPFNDPCRGWNVIWSGPTMPAAGIDLDCPPEFGITGSTNTYQINNLLAGSYEVIVEDYNNCADTLNIEISEPPPIVPEFTINQPECTGDYGTVSVVLESDDGTPGSEGFDIIWTGENNADTIGLEVVAPSFLPYDINNVEVGAISISIIDNNNCSYTESLTIIEPSLTALSGDTSICNGFTTQFTGTGASAINDPWQSSNESVATINNSGLLTALSPGVTTITYTTVDGCIASQEIVVNEIPTILAFPDTSICVGGTAILNADGAGVSGTYSWSPSSTLNTSSGDVVEASPSTTTITQFLV